MELEGKCVEVRFLQEFKEMCGILYWSNCRTPGLKNKRKGEDIMRRFIPWLAVLVVILHTITPAITQAQSAEWRELTAEETWGIHGYANTKGTRVVAAEVDGVTLYGVAHQEQLIIPITAPHIFAITVYDSEVLVNPNAEVRDGKLRIGQGLISYDLTGNVNSRTDIYNYADELSDGIRVAAVNDVTPVYVDRDWNRIPWDDVQKLPTKTSFSEGLAVVGNLTGDWYIDTSGQRVFAEKWTSANKFSHGHALVGYAVEGRIYYGAINKRGELVLPYRYEYTRIEYIPEDDVFKVYEPINNDFVITGEDTYTGTLDTADYDANWIPTYYKYINGETTDITESYNLKLDERAEEIGTETHIIVKVYNNNEVIRRTTRAMLDRDILQMYAEVYGKPVEVSDEEWAENGKADVYKASLALQEDGAILFFYSDEELESYLFEQGIGERTTGDKQYLLLGYDGFEKDANGYAIFVSYSEMQAMIRQDPESFPLSGRERYQHRERTFRVKTPQYDANGKERDSVVEDLRFNSIDELLSYFNIDASATVDELSDGIPLTSKTFTDTNRHWAKATIEKWSRFGILEGNPDGTFKPDATITRAEFSVILARLLNLQETGRDISKSFADVRNGDWFASAVGAVYDKGYTADLRTYDGAIRNFVFKPNQGMTREEVVVALSRFYHSMEGPPNPFKDNEDITPHALGPINAFVEAGFIQGTPDGYFLPKKAITRAELLTIIDKMVRHYIVNEETYQQFLNDNSDMANSVVIINYDRAQDIVIRNKQFRNLYVTDTVRTYVHVDNKSSSVLIRDLQ